MPQIIQQTGIPFNAFYGLGGQAPLIPNTPAPAPAAAATAPAPAAPIAPTTSGKTALQGNLTNWGDITALVDKINALNVAAQQKANAARIPNATGLEATSSANIGAALKGQLPGDVVAQLAQGAAERGIGGGQAGGDQVNAAYLKALGLNSLNMQNTGQGWLNSAYSRNPGASTYDPSQLLITPYQQAQIDYQQQQLAQQAKIAEQQLAAENARTAIAQFNAMLNRGGRNTPYTPSYGYSPASAAVGGGVTPQTDWRSSYTYSPTLKDLWGNTQTTPSYSSGGQDIAPAGSLADETYQWLFPDLYPTSNTYSG